MEKIGLTTCLCHQLEGMKRPHDGWGGTTSILVIESKASAKANLRWVLIQFQEAVEIGC